MSGIALHTLTVFAGFFAIMNPLANTGIFLGLTQGDDPATRRAVALRAVLLAFAIVVAFMVAGKVIFTLFGITLPAFKITGGFLVFLIGYHMLQGETSPIHTPTAEDNRKSREAALDVAVSPLAMPVLAGPGTIAAAKNFVGTGGATEMAITVTAFGFLCLITYISCVFGGRVIAYVGDSGIKVVTRMMGLILAVVGVQMLIGGIRGAMSLPG
jgi:multiple antibiotic resistance protein